MGGTSGFPKDAIPGQPEGWELEPMTETRVNGLKAGHAIITPDCRKNRGTTFAFLEAADRLRKLYDDYARSEGSEGVSWHLVLVREDTTQ